MVGFNFRNFFLRNDAIYARILQLTISGILFSAAPAVWVSLGYLDPFAWFLEWADIVLAFILMISSLRTKVLTSTLRLSSMVFISLAIAITSFYESSYYPTFILFFIPLILLGLGLTISKGNAKYSSLLFFITAVTVLSAFSILYLAVAPAIPTDETLLTLYAAHIFMSGLNPYSPGVMNNSFAFYNFPVYLGTPFTTGGNVHSLTYPALSFILQIPSAVFNLRTSYIMLPFLMIPAFLIWFKTWSVKKWKESILVLFPLIGLLIYSSQASNADLNPVWASFLMTSYFVLPRTKLSGVFLIIDLIRLAQRRRRLRQKTISLMLCFRSLPRRHKIRHRCQSNFAPPQSFLREAFLPCLPMAQQGVRFAAILRSGRACRASGKQFDRSLDGYIQIDHQWSAVGLNTGPASIVQAEQRVFLKVRHRIAQHPLSAQ